jgi:hypothetical protein
VDNFKFLQKYRTCMAVPVPVISIYRKDHFGLGLTKPVPVLGMLREQRNQLILTLMNTSHFTSKIKGKFDTGTN